MNGKTIFTLFICVLFINLINFGLTIFIISDFKQTVNHHFSLIQESIIKANHLKEEYKENIINLNQSLMKNINSEEIKSSVKFNNKDFMYLNEFKKKLNIKDAEIEDVQNVQNKNL